MEPDILRVIKAVIVMDESDDPHEIVEAHKKAIDSLQAIAISRLNSIVRKLGSESREAIRESIIRAQGGL